VTFALVVAAMIGGIVIGIAAMRSRSSTAKPPAASVPVVTASSDAGTASIPVPAASDAGGTFITEAAATDTSTTSAAIAQTPPDAEVAVAPKGWDAAVTTAPMSRADAGVIAAIAATDMPDAGVQAASFPDAAVVRPATRPPKPVEVAPVPAVGVLSLKSTPPCDVTIDGKSSGRTPSTASLPAGRHHVTLVNTTYGIKRSFNVDVKAGEVNEDKRDYSDQVHAAPNTTVDPFAKKQAPR
jgi:serine/threonine-protein kinase